MQRRINDLTFYTSDTSNTCDSCDVTNQRDQVGKFQRSHFEATGVRAKQQGTASP